VTAQPERRGEPPEPSKLADRRKRAVKRPAEARDAARDAAREGFTIITGLSGAGRSEAARCLEDIGYFVVDKDSTPDRLVFNRTVTLRDQWARITKGQKA